MPNTSTGLNFCALANSVKFAELFEAYLLFADGTAYYEAAFGAGSGDIFLDDVQCSSSSSQLLECQSSQLLASNCDHSRDAGVGCEGV